MRFLCKGLTILALSLSNIGVADACLWDRDTLNEEAKGFLSPVHASVGWFDRYPPEYYEMRLDRITPLLATSPDELALYDDVAVACDRLGRGDEAIAWMEQKRLAMGRLGTKDDDEQRYRYLANLGTFHVHRWIHRDPGERSKNLSDLGVGEALIASAIELNPDAHFGREKYQLIAIRWLLADPSNDDGDGSFLGIRLEERPDTSAISKEAIRGLVGLIELGAAWQSVDIYHALDMALRTRGEAYLALLARLRTEELLEAGSASIHPQGELVTTKIKELANYTGPVADPSTVKTFFVDARQSADKRQAQRVAYMDVRFAKGEHPDTHPKFWQAWQEPSFPSMPGATLGAWFYRNLGLVVFVIVVVVGTGIVCLFVRFTRHLQREMKKV